MFAGLILPSFAGAPLTGVVVCNSAGLADEHKAHMARAQARFESEVRLHLHARTEQLQALAKKVFAKGPCNFGHVWAQWKNGEGDSDILYELARWLERGASGPIQVPRS